MGLLVSGRSKLAGATTDRSETRADAGGVWSTAGWQPAITSLFAQPGREPGGLGRFAARSLSARLGRQEPASDCQRRMPGIGGSPADCLSRVPHQRCWVHKMRNILERVRKCDYARVKQDAQAIYLAESLREAQQAFRTFQVTGGRAIPPWCGSWRRISPSC